LAERGPDRIPERFLSGGIAMILVGAALACMGAYLSGRSLIDAGRRSPVLFSGFGPLYAAATFSLLIGILLLLLRVYLKSTEDEVRSILADSVRSHGGDLHGTADCRATAGAASRLLDRVQEDFRVALNQAREDQEKRVREVTEAHNDLITRHLFTKKMLRAYRSDEVLEALLKGVREGLGFPGAALGILDPSGDLVFGSGSGGNGKGRVGIPGWNEESLLARTVWGGKAAMLSSLDGQRHCREDRTVLGDGPAFLVPVTRKLSRKCSDVLACSHLECPAYELVDTRCWIEGFSTCRMHDSGTPEEKRKECLRCEMFAPSGILLVRSHPRSRPITQKTMKSVVALVREAATALELVEMNENTKKLSITDGLTGLANHREFYQSLSRELARARRYGHSLSLLMIDVDDFKLVNDRFGHLVGDGVLRQIAGLLRGFVRVNDTVARYGGEEFGIILPEATPAGALMIAERIKAEIGRHRFFETNGATGNLTVSIGIYSMGKDDVSEQKMVKFADEAAYLAKQLGKNRVVVKDHV
jgi:diguanylate cyclase (GGDEF)-like protein